VRKDDLASRLQVLESEKEAMKKKKLSRNAERADEIFREYKKYLKAHLLCLNQVQSEGRNSAATTEQQLRCNSSDVSFNGRLITLLPIQLHSTILPKNLFKYNLNLRITC